MLSFLFFCSYVFSDAAQYIKNENGSPYQRATYRYTPFLAYFLSKLPHREYGRVLFCIADTVCGYIIALYRRTNRKRLRNNSPTEVLDDPESERLEDAMWWLYNPLAINICTRGSAESLMVLLPVLLTVWITTYMKEVTRTSKLTLNNNNNNHHHHHWMLRYCSAAILAGFCHGIAIHAKLYPIIYTLSFMTQFVIVSDTNEETNSIGGSVLSTTPLRSMVMWIRRLLLSPASMLFGISTVVTFASITCVAVLWYGPDAINEGLLYHFSRVDHRHNYSMHWYWIYLLRDRIVTSTSLLSPVLSTTVLRDSINIHPQMLTKLIGMALLFPQMILLLYSSIGIAPHSLSLALFVQTFLFVAHNKVITAQYFTWYLCLLPLCSDQFRITRRVQYALLLLGLSIVFWLSSAYCLEMQGMAVHQIVWLASLLFFVANVNLLGALLSTTVGLQRKHVVGKVKLT
jgi:phosphatidylinositol glycan class M